MDANSCARILYGESGGWKPEPSDTGGIDSARTALAEAIWASGDGTGFASPARPDPTDQNWLACQTTAAATQGSSVGPAALWVAVDNPADSVALEAAHPWLRNASQPGEFGPFLIGTTARARTLFVFRGVDPAVAGRFPRRAGDVAAAPAKPPATSKTKSLLLVIFLACVGGMGLTAYWSYDLGADLTKSARAGQAFWRSYPDAALAAEVTEVIARAKIDRQVAEAVAKPAVQASKPAQTGWSSAAATELGRTLRSKATEGVERNADFAKLPSGERGRALERLKATFDAYLEDRDGLRPASANLAAPWGMTIFLVVVMLAILGSSTKRTMAGVLVGDRNRLSLSRLQMYTWTTLVVTMFLVTSTFLIGVAPAESLLPAYPWSIWALLGISIGTVPVSGLILKAKEEQKPTEQALLNSKVEADSRLGVLEKRTTSLSWRFLDFFTAEEISNADEVDVSRFQNVLFTIVLATIFIGWCAQILWEMSFTEDWREWAKSESHPTLDATFIGLLAVSHGSYLAFKGITKTETSDR